MKFHKYSSIAAWYHDKTINTIIQEGQTTQEYVVTEKIHGSHLGFCIGPNEARIVKRTNWVGQPESFFNSSTVFQENQAAISKIWDLFIKKYPDTKIKCITVHGEIFGGLFPSDKHNWGKQPNTQKVQNGVYYSPHNHFTAFDIFVDNFGSGYYLSVDEANELFSDAGFLYQKPLFRGSFQDALAYDHDFDTLMPQLLGLPHLTDNQSEGVVIRPVVDSYLRCGNRIILKKKNDKFIERSRLNPSGNRKGPKKLTDAETTISNELARYNTVGRIESVLSKLDPSKHTWKYFGEVLGLVVKDIIDDFAHSALYHSYLEHDKKSRRMLNKLLGSQVSNTLREYAKTNWD